MPILAVADRRIPRSIAASLERRGYTVLRLPPHPALPPPVASHPDMVLFFGKNSVVTTREYAQIAKEELLYLTRATGRILKTVTESVRQTYPDDILLNAARVGQYLFCLPAHTSEILLSDPSVTVVPVRQGYAKCSVIPVSDRALITADPSIAGAAEQVGLRVLRVRPGFVSLPGYDTGFIGGATCFATDGGMNKILFCGELDSHPDADDIRRFCAENGRTADSLCPEELTDFGTVFLTERRN